MIMIMIMIMIIINNNNNNTGGRKCTYTQPKIDESIIQFTMVSIIYILE